MPTLPVCLHAELKVYTIAGRWRAEKDLWTSRIVARHRDVEDTVRLWCNDLRGLREVEGELRSAQEDQSLTWQDFFVDGCSAALQTLTTRFIEKSDVEQLLNKVKECVKEPGPRNGSKEPGDKEASECLVACLGAPDHVLGVLRAACNVHLESVFGTSVLSTGGTKSFAQVWAELKDDLVKSLVEAYAEDLVSSARTMVMDACERKEQGLSLSVTGEKRRKLDESISAPEIHNAALKCLLMLAHAVVKDY